MIPFAAAPYFAAAMNELEHTTAQVVWHVRQADRAVVLSILPRYAPWYHLFAELDGEWLPVASGFSRWMSYDEPGPTGVLMDLAPVAERVVRGRVSYRGQVHESEARDGYLCTVIWDVARPEPEEELGYEELLVGETWARCIVPWAPATAEQFAAAYLVYREAETEKERDENWWAVEMLLSLPRDDRLTLALAVVDYADLSVDKEALGAVGAGPLEDLMSDWLLDRLETRIRVDPKLRYALGVVRMEFEDEALRKRLAGLLRAS